MPPSGAGGTAVINPGDFAAYVFTIVAGIGAVGVIGAVVRRIGGPPRHRRVEVSRNGVTEVIGGAEGEPDSGRVERLAADLDGLRDEVTGLRRELDDAQNRLDFTERLLGQAKERGLLNPPKDR